MSATNSRVVLFCGSVILGSAAVGFTGCGSSGDSDLESRVTKLEEQVAALQQENQQLRNMAAKERVEVVPVSNPAGALRFPIEVERAMMGQGRYSEPVPQQRLVPELVEPLERASPRIEDSLEPLRPAEE